MPLETSPGFIDGLTPEWPLATDPQKDGDDHIRMIKQVLKNTFPTLNTALTATAENINFVTNQIRHFAADNADPANPLPETFAVTNVDNTGYVPVLGGTSSPQFMTTYAPKTLVNWEQVMNVLYHVGYVLTTKRAGNPVDWLGFGTWAPLVGGIWGVGDAGDTNGVVVHTPLGYTAGFHVVEQGHIKYQENAITVDLAGDHQHTTPTNEAGSWHAALDNGGYYANEVDGLTGWSGNHDHTGRVGIGTMTPTPYLPARNGVYAWERTA